MQRREKTTLLMGFACLAYSGLILLSPNVAGSVAFYGVFAAACAAVFVGCYYAYKFVYIVDRDRFKRAADLARLAEMLEAQRAERRNTD